MGSSWYKTTYISGVLLVQDYLHQWGPLGTRLLTLVGSSWYNTTYISGVLLVQDCLHQWGPLGTRLLTLVGSSWYKTITLVGSSWYKTTYISGVLQVLIYLGLPHEHVATASPPQHTLEHRQTLKGNDTSDKPMERGGRGEGGGDWGDGGEVR